MKIKVTVETFLSKEDVREYEKVLDEAMCNAKILMDNEIKERVRKKWRGIKSY